MIEVEHLSKDYGTVVAVRDLSFRVGGGEVVGFLGPNGAGKSTTLRILAGFLGATRGSVRIDGLDVVREPLAAKQRLGYMPESAPLYPEMRVGEYLSFRAAVKRVPRGKRKAATGRAMELCAVANMRDTLVAHLSKGYRQRVALADALVASPPLLILDEPTAGLDPNQIRETRKLIRELGETHTILLSTHILSEVEATCDRALVIDRGQLVAQGALAELRELGQTKTLEVELNDPEQRAEALLADLTGVERLSATRREALLTLTLHVNVAPAEMAESVARACVAANVGVRSLTPGKASLEEVFATLTEHEPPAEPGS
ncbi:MAG: ABC transporter ATP-binding protein [Polyangiaceae bacterium]